MVDDRRSGPVSLGCGTLIVIGIIVLLFSGGGRIQDMETELRSMHSELGRLRTVIEQQTQEIRDLRDAVDQERKHSQP